LLAGPDDQYDDADDGERDQPPPPGSVDVVQTADANRKAWKKTDEVEDRAQRRNRAVLERSIIQDAGGDSANQREENPKPEFRSRGAPRECDVVPKSGCNGLRKIHFSP